MIITVRYDGNVLIPEGKLDLPIGEELKVTYLEIIPKLPSASDGNVKDDRPLMRLWETLQSIPPGPDDGTTYPSDYSEQLDHYLYGTPKKP